MENYARQTGSRAQGQSCGRGTGELLVTGGGTTVMLVATGAKVPLPLVAQTPSPACPGASDDQDTGQKQTDDQDENELNGTIASVDAVNSSFVLQLANEVTKTVEVSAKTVFDDGFHSIADLKVGLCVKVEDTLQSNGTLTATSVHPEPNASDDDHDDSNSGDNTGESRSGDGGDHVYALPTLL